MRGVAHGYETDARIVDLRDSGVNVSAICRQLCVGRDHVYATLRRSGVIVPVYKAGTKLSDDQVRELRDLRHAGWKYADLGARFGVSTVMAWKTCNGWREGVQ